MKILKDLYFKKILLLNLIGIFCLPNFGIAKENGFNNPTNNITDTSYLKSGNKLDDYILDTGDNLSIEFIKTPEFSGKFKIDEQGEIYLPRLKNSYIRGLTIKELQKLLELKYNDYLIKPEIYIRLINYKPIRISINGEVRKPGRYKFSPFDNTKSSSVINPTNSANILSSQVKKQRSINSFTDNNISGNPISLDNTKKENEYLTTLSNSIRKGGGLTSFSDIKNIEIIRDIPLGKGGGKKRTTIDFSNYLYQLDSSNDLQLYDGDYISIPRLNESDPNILKLSILSGLTPKFVSVNISGQIENPGTYRLPVEASVVDALNLAGPTKVLSGKIYLIRYLNDGTLLRKNLKISFNAKPGSNKNPTLMDGDFITVKNSLLGRSAGTIKTITEPVIGIYTTKELINSFNE